MKAGGFALTVPHSQPSPSFSTVLSPSPLLLSSLVSATDALGTSDVQAEAGNPTKRMLLMTALLRGRAGLAPTMRAQMPRPLASSGAMQPTGACCRRVILRDFFFFFFKQETLKCYITVTWVRHRCTNAIGPLGTAASPSHGLPSTGCAHCLG